MATWNGKRVAGCATAIVLSIFIPVAIDQGYFRHNAYILPIAGLVAASLFAGLILNSPAVSGRIQSFHHGFGVAHPLKYLLTVATAGGCVILALGGGEWYAIHTSLKHVAELRRADSLASAPALPPAAQPIPLASSSSSAGRKGAPKAKGTSVRVARQPKEELPETTQPPKQANSEPVTQPPPVNVCPNGNCGGTLINPTVNNNYAASQPPPAITWTGSRVEDATPPRIGNASSGPKHPGLSLVVKLLGRFQFPMFTVSCSRPCEAVWIGVEGASAPGLYATNNPLVAAAGFRGMPAFLDAGSTVWITVASKDENDINVLSVDPYVARQ